MTVAANLAQFNTNASDEFTTFHSADEAFAELCRLYDDQTRNIRDAYRHFKKLEEVSDFNGFRLQGFYPRLRIQIDSDQINRGEEFSHGTFKEEGTYELNVSDPRSYHDLLGQMAKVQRNTKSIKFQVGLSREQIPLHYAMRNLHFNLDSDRDMTPERAEIARRIFAKRDPLQIEDYLSSHEPPKGNRLLLPYNGQRFDQAEHQFFYYTKTPFAALQPYVIFSNYNQYIDDLYKYGVEQIKKSFNASANPNAPQVVAVVRTGFEVVIKDGLPAEELEKIKAIKKDTERKGLKGAQMPACHLLMSDGIGMSAIDLSGQDEENRNTVGTSILNTSVGAPNILTLSDLIAPKRSHGWIMAGHAAGVTPNIKVGDYVYGEGYFINPITPNARGTGFDYSVMRTVACPQSSEMQRAFSASVKEYAAEIAIDPDTIKRTAAVVSTEYRMWERFKQTNFEIQETNAAVLEMETAFLALKAREQSIPFGAFLKVSDMPHYDLPKTSAAVDDFFGNVGVHLGIIISAIDKMKEEHMDNMHSRKNRRGEGSRVFAFQ